MDPVWLGGFALLVPGAVAETLRRIVPRQMLHSVSARRAAEKARTAAKQVSDTRLELGILENEISDTKSAISAAEGRLIGLNRMKAEYGGEKALIVHEIGRPARDAKLFQAFVINRTAHDGLMMDGVKINPIWATRHLVQVWGDTVQAARVEIETAYPHNLGYEIDFKGESNYVP